MNDVNLNKYYTWGSYSYPLTFYSGANTITIGSPSNDCVISEPKIVEIAAYGLGQDEIIIKEIDGIITVKNKKVDRFHAEINKKYTLKNTKLTGVSLYQGVLLLSFDDGEDVIYHEIA